MMDDFKEFLELPGTPQEQEWLKERLETLSVRESYALAAVSMGYPPEKAADAIKSILSLPDCTLHPAGSYEDLGKYSQKGAASLPEDVLPYVDFDHIGQEFEDEHPGLFIGGYYVEYPKKAAEPAYSGKNAFLPEDSDWSVKLKLASPAVPEGVWLRLPGYDGKMAEDADEVVLALDELRVKSLEDCTLLEGVFSPRPETLRSSIPALPIWFGMGIISAMFWLSRVRAKRTGWTSLPPLWSMKTAVP